jgi:uncharacterized lipoprotein YmbA
MSDHDGKLRAFAGCRAAILAACAAAIFGCAGQADRFYALSTLPGGAHPPASGFSSHVILSVSIPSLVDRRQMIMEAAGDQILVLEHERWAAAPSDLVSQTLARDIEQRRPDILVAGRGFDQPNLKPIQVKVDIVRMSARRGGQATLEARWRITDPASSADAIGGETFTAPLEGEEYAAIARAFSKCLASLADRLISTFPSH